MLGGRRDRSGHDTGQNGKLVGASQAVSWLAVVTSSPDHTLPSAFPPTSELGLRDASDL